MRVLSYNILANAYIKPAWFAATPAALLVPGARTGALARRISDFDADVVCLQEVEEDVFNTLASTLSGYRGEWLQKGAGKPDGCATFTRQRPQASARLHYSDGTGHVALVTVVEHDGCRVAIANTHARWSPAETPRADHLGARQLTELLARRDELAPSADAWIVCGDLNAPPASDAIAVLIEAGFSDGFADHPAAHTCNSNGAPKRIDFIFTAGLESAPLLPPRITSDTALPSNDEPSDHLPIAVDLIATAGR